MNTDKWGKQVEVLFLVQTYLAMFSCLLRTDYNQPLGLWGYIIWSARKLDGIKMKRKLMFMQIISIFLDMIWYIICYIEWDVESKARQAIVWNKLQNLRNISLSCGILETVCKAVNVYALGTMTDDDEEFEAETKELLQNKGYR